MAPCCLPPSTPRSSASRPRAARSPRTTPGIDRDPLYHRLAARPMAAARDRDFEDRHLEIRFPVGGRDDRLRRRREGVGALLGTEDPTALRMTGRGGWERSTHGYPFERIAISHWTGGDAGRTPSGPLRGIRAACRARAHLLDLRARHVVCRRLRERPGGVGGPATDDSGGAIDDLRYVRHARAQDQRGWFPRPLSPGRERSRSPPRARSAPISRGHEIRTRAESTVLVDGFMAPQGTAQTCDPHLPPASPSR